MLTPISFTRGLAGCTTYDANNVCLVFDPTTPDDVLTPTPKPPTGTPLVPLTKCPWYSTPTIGASSLTCVFPSTSVLILGGAAILGLAFFSMRN